MSDTVGAAYEEECRDIPYSVATLIKQMALEPCRNILKFYRDIRNKVIK